MKSTTLTISDPNLLAEFVREDEFRAFFEKRIQVPPDHLGLLMRNGQFVEAYKGAHFSVGGMMHHIKGLIGGSHSISLLIADLKTFQAWYKFVATTKDKLEVEGTVVLDMQINPEKPQNILGLMSARKSLSKDDVASRIKPHLWDRVFEAAISRINASEVRGNKGLQDMLQADIMKEVERVAGDLGVLIRAASVSWALNDVEKKEMARAAAMRDIEQAEFEFNRLKRDLEREQETTEVKITNKIDLDKLNLRNEADLEQLVLKQEIDFVDARETGKRVQEMKVLEHEINTLRTERLATFENELQRATHAGVDLKVIDERRRVVERNTAALDTEHRLALRALERDYDSETRGLQRHEDRSIRREDRADQRSDRLEDRADQNVARTEDRDYGFETREKELDTRRKERGYDDETREGNLGFEARQRDQNFDGRRKEVDVVDKEEYARLARLREQNKATAENLRDLQNLEIEIERDRMERRIKEDDAFHRRDMDARKLEAQREVDRLSLGSKMTPEQILAINAGLSPDVAKVLEEQAKAKGADNKQVMDLMREMVDQANRARVDTAEQARAMFQMGMDGTVGVAAGAGPGGMPKPKVEGVRGGPNQQGGGGGGGGGNANAGGNAANNAEGGGGAAEPRRAEAAGDAKVECHKCGRENQAKARFCIGCGEQLRR